MGQYLSDFVPRHLRSGAADTDGWSHDWTIFYWANWLAWTPVTALFLGRLGIGWTVREFLRVNLLFPSLFGIIWMTVFGGAAMYFDSAQGELYQAVEAAGPEAAVYSLFEKLPGSSILSIFFLLIAFLSYTTAADSNTTAMGGIVFQGEFHRSRRNLAGKSRYYGEWW